MVKVYRFHLDQIFNEIKLLDKENSIKYYVGQVVIQF